VRQSDLLDDRPHVPVDEKAAPDGVGGACLGVRDGWVALGEGEVERVADGHRQRREDEVERNDEQSECCRRRARLKGARLQRSTTHCLRFHEVSVRLRICLYVCLFVCLSARIAILKTTVKFHQLFCTRYMWPCLGAPLGAMRFRFCG